MARSKNASPIVLVTRPAHQAGSLMTALTLRGYTPIAAPVLEFVPIEAVYAEGPYRAIVFTSANAVRAFAQADKRRGLPVYVVGEATAAAARAAQFERVIIGQTGAEDLSTAIMSDLPAGSSVLYPSARDNAFDMSSALRDGAISVDRIVAYAMEPASALPEAARSALANPAFVLLLSARSATAFGRLAGDLSRISAICLSKKVAEAAALFAFSDVQFAALPTEAALLDRLEGVRRDL